MVITDRKLCRVPFLQQIERIAQAGPGMIILREKDLSPEELMPLASDVWHICLEYDVPMSVNGCVQVARRLCNDRVHVPIDVLRNEDLSDFRVIGASVHSLTEAMDAEYLGADYVIAGHIFPTACKLGAEPRGLDFVKEICRYVNIPVFAVGGITPENCDSVRMAGASGVCVMSSAMTSEDPKALIEGLRGSA